MGTGEEPVDPDPEDAFESEPGSGVSPSDRFVDVSKPVRVGPMSESPAYKPTPVELAKAVQLYNQERVAVGLEPVRFDKTGDDGFHPNLDLKNPRGPLAPDLPLKNPKGPLAPDFPLKDKPRPPGSNLPWEAQPLPFVDEPSSLDGVHEYLKGTTYWMQPSPLIELLTSNCGVLGGDSRGPKGKRDDWVAPELWYPWSAICAIYLKRGTKGPKRARGGTAFFIGPRVLMTAAHTIEMKKEDRGVVDGVVIPWQHGERYSGMLFGDTQCGVFDEDHFCEAHGFTGEFDGTDKELSRDVMWEHMPWGKFKIEKAFTLKQWRNSNIVANDIGLLVVEDSPRLAGIGWFGLQALSYSSLKGKGVDVYGYAGNAEPGLCPPPYGEMKLGGTHDIISLVQARMLRFRNDISPGHSGSPIFSWNDGAVAYGVVSGGAKAPKGALFANKGSRLNSDIIESAVEIIEAHPSAFAAKFPP